MTFPWSGRRTTVLQQVQKWMRMLIGDDQDAATIAASVSKPAAMVAAETRLRVLQTKETESSAKSRGVREELNSIYLRIREVSAGRLIELETIRANHSARLSELLAKKRECENIIEAHRPAYTAAITTALMPMRKAAAERIAVAIAELQSAAAILDATVVEIKQAGATSKQLMPRLFLGPLAASAQSILAEAEQATKIQSAA